MEYHVTLIGFSVRVLNSKNCLHDNMVSPTAYLCIKKMVTRVDEGKWGRESEKVCLLAFGGE